MVTQLIGGPSSESITFSDFQWFLSVFGPFQSCLTRCQVNVFTDDGNIQKWFHGRSSHSQCTNVLNQAPNIKGSYLVRYSSNPSALTIQIKNDHNRSVRSSVSYEIKSQEYVMRKQDDSELCRSKTLPEVLQVLTSSNIISTPVGKPSSSVEDNYLGLDPQTPQATTGASGDMKHSTAQAQVSSL